MFVVSPAIHREVVRVFDFRDAAGLGQADYSVSRVCVEVPHLEAWLVQDKKKVITKAKPGDRLCISAAVTGKVKKRIIDVECHPMLYKLGSPTFRRRYTAEDTLFSPLVWEAFEPLDLAKLPYLYEVYIIDGVVR